MKSALRDSEFQSVLPKEQLRKISASLERSLKRLISRPIVEIETTEISIKRFSTFIDCQPDLADVVIIENADGKAEAGWIIDRALISNIVECIFGGTARVGWATPTKHYSNLELAIRQKVLELLCEGIRQGFKIEQEPSVLSFREERRVVNSSVCDAAQTVVHAVFRVLIGSGQSTVTMFAPIGMAGDDNKSVDAGKEPEMGDEDVAMAASDSPLSTVPSTASTSENLVVGKLILSNISLSIAQLMSLSIGQVIPIRLEKNPCAFVLHDRVLFKGQPGISDGKYGMKIVEVRSDSSLGSNIAPQHGVEDLGTMPSRASGSTER